MAASKNKAESADAVKAVEVDGVDVQVDTSYTQSWDGMRKAARMASSERTDEEKGVAMFEYYERAIANLDDVSDAMAGKPADAVMGLLSRAVMAATPKN